MKGKEELKHLTQREMQTLKRAHEILNSIYGELYEDLLDASCEPMMAAQSLGEIISAVDAIRADHVVVRAAQAV